LETFRRDHLPAGEVEGEDASETVVFWRSLRFTQQEDDGGRFIVPSVTRQAWFKRLYLPAYSVAEAARYAQTSTQNVAYWHYRGGKRGPVLPGRERGKPLSYLELVEIAFVATFRRLNVSLQRIRKAHEYLAQTFDFEYPFAQLRLKTEGHHVLLELQQVEQDADLGNLILADTHGQVGWKKLVGERFAEFDYEDGLALVWHLAGRESPVKIDPRISFGAPTVRGIPTWAVKGRWVAGESIEDIEEDFGLEEHDIKAGLRFEEIEIAA